MRWALGLLIAIAAVVLVVVTAIACAQHFGLWAGMTHGGLSFVFPAHDSDGESIRALRIGGANQSATYLGERWFVPYGAYIKHYDCMFGAEIPVENVLMLGGGGYSYPKYALSTNPDLAMDVVEIDPKVTQLARRYFYLDQLEDVLQAQGQEERLGLIAADAVAFIETCDKAYDAVLNDTFLGAQPNSWFCSRAGLAQVKRVLAPKGVYVSNVISPLEGPEAQGLRELVEQLEAVFAHVFLLRCLPVSAHVHANNLVIATDGDYEWHGARRAHDVLS